MLAEQTIVYMARREKRRNHRLLFGRPARHIRLDWQRSLAAFKPGDLFGYERWEANKYGTQLWTINVLQAGAKGDDFVRVPGVKPGANILLQRRGVEACKTFFAIADGLRENRALEAVSSTDWCVIGHRLSAGIKPEYILKDLGFAE